MDEWTNGELDKWRGREQYACRQPRSVHT